MKVLCANVCCSSARELAFCDCELLFEWAGLVFADAGNALVEFTLCRAVCNSSFFVIQRVGARNHVAIAVHAFSPRGTARGQRTR